MKNFLFRSFLTHLIVSGIKSSIRVEMRLKWSESELNCQECLRVRRRLGTASKLLFPVNGGLGCFHTFGVCLMSRS